MPIIRALLIILALRVSGHAQLGQVWQTTYGGASYDEVEVAEVALDGGIIAAGFTYSSGQADGWVTKLNKNGLVQWSKVMVDTLSDDTLRSVKPTADGGFIACGQFVSTKIGGFKNEDAWVVKFDAFGAVQWSRLYGSYVTGSGRGSSDRCYGIVEVTGGYLFAGWQASFQSTVGDEHSRAWAVRLDTIGRVLWAKSYPAMSGGGAEPDTMGDYLLATSDGGFLVTAINWNYSSADWAHGNSFIFKIDSSGNQLWRAWWDGGLEDRLWGVVEDGSGTYWASGFSADVDGSKDITLMHFGADGTVISSANYGTALTEQSLGGLSPITIAANGNIMVAGFQTVAAADSGLILEIDKTDGSVVNQYVIGVSLTQIDSLRLSGSNYIISGHSNSNGFVSLLTSLSAASCAVAVHAKRTGLTVNSVGNQETVTISLGSITTVNGPDAFTPGPLDLTALSCS